MTHHERQILTLVDAHVHVYRSFDVARMLDAALANFSAEAARQGASGFQGVILLAETAREHWYADRAAGGAVAYARWRVMPHHSGDCVLEARRDGGEQLFIIAGSQMVTAERLEVLALCTARRFEDDQPIEPLLGRIIAAGGLAVVPWAVGKWLGQRGRLVSRLIERGVTPMFLGDNSGRPALWPAPVQFEDAAQAGIRLLPGTDPLPLTGEELRVGSFGFACRSAPLAGRPAEQLQRLLMAPESELTPFGRLERPLRFIRNQAALRLGRAGGSGSGAPST